MVVGTVLGLGAAVAVVAVVRREDVEATPSPAAGLRCGDADAPVDCFVAVPGGRVVLGAQAETVHARQHDPAAEPEEGPLARGRVDAFWIQRTEATVDTWRRCVQAGVCRAEDVGTRGVFATAYDPAGEADPTRDRMPVVAITWAGAARLCAFLGGRLPTEAEWERAVRGDDARRWPWGDDARCPPSGAEPSLPHLRRAVEATCQGNGATPVDELPPLGPHGLAGTAGNAAEWTVEPWSDGPRRPGEPLGDGDERVLRGGSWMATSPDALRVTVREPLGVDEQLDDVGVRCVVGGPVR